ncbi:hypothetical protein PR202_gb22212 [Eleusine coracana subsp. coracana]|uniref:Uncharacterized protein n=1 Tax=Eleusine coracana subsp. coracana TaxID=191504 RepID=A0AAV5FFY5_ELECO|nr:hypothetical protein PR202_gb22212 [Eleusine coracana subsp. coracana]
MEMASPPPPRLCVTGAGGFVASWLVKLLLSRGYAVHATVRNPGGPETINNKFWQLVDVRDVVDAMLLAYQKAESSGRYICALDQMDIKDLVVLMKSMYQNYNYVDKQVSLMADVDYKAETTSGKLKSLGWTPRKLEETLADSIEYFEKAGLLQDEEPCRLPYFYRPRVCVTGAGGYIASWLVKLLLSRGYAVHATVRDPGGPDTINNKFWAPVHVHDVADALLLVYEKPESSGRYICALEQMDIKDMVNLLKSKYPNYDYVDKMVDVDFGLAVSSEKLRNLGWKPRSREETLADGLEFLEKAGLLKEPCRLPYFYRMNAEE